MTKRALIVGISDYTPIAPPLASSMVEIERWRELLVGRYGFSDSNVRLLREYHATKAATIDRLAWLLADSGPGDQLVFVFCGHGLRTKRRHVTADPLDVCEEALVLHPAGMTRADDVALFESELASMYHAIGVARGALPTFILDCCFSAGIDLRPAQAFGGFAQATADLEERDRQTVAVVRFGLRLARPSASAPPLVVAGSDESAFATEIEIGGVTRSRFSSLAIKALSSNPALTYEELLRYVAGEMETVNQEPSLRGAPERIQNCFLQ